MQFNSFVLFGALNPPTVIFVKLELKFYHQVIEIPIVSMLKVFHATTLVAWDNYKNDSTKTTFI
jgi:hypothetical protein